MFELYDYYFSEDLSDYADRMEYYLGDLSDSNLGLSEFDYGKMCASVDFVFNAAAKVQHFGNWVSFKTQNIDTVQNLISLCTTGRAKKFILISTASVDEGAPRHEKVFSEKTECLECSDVENLYVKSKIMAETLLFGSCDFTNWAIIRVGNIVFDSKKCVFQKNWHNNAFLARLSTFVRDKTIPKKTLYNEYGFVDNVANAVRLLSSVDGERQIFHLWNSNRDWFDKIVEHDKDIEVVDSHAYLERIRTAILRNESGSFANVLIHTDFDHLLQHPRCVQDNAYTEAVLRKIGFKWSTIDAEIEKKFLSNLKEVSYEQ